jgi:hypothetical protein
MVHFIVLIICAVALSSLATAQSKPIQETVR